MRRKFFVTAAGFVSLILVGWTSARAASTCTLPKGKGAIPLVERSLSTAEKSNPAKVSEVRALRSELQALAQKGEAYSSKAEPIEAGCRGIEAESARLRVSHEKLDQDRKPLRDRIANLRQTWEQTILPRGRSLDSEVARYRAEGCGRTFNMRTEAAAYHRCEAWRVNFQGRSAAHKAEATRIRNEWGQLAGRIRAMGDLYRTAYEAFRARQQKYRAGLKTYQTDRDAWEGQVRQVWAKTNDLIMEAGRKRAAGPGRLAAGLAQRQAEAARTDPGHVFDGRPAAPGAVDTRGVKKWAPGEREREQQKPRAQPPARVTRTLPPPPPPPAPAQAPAAKPQNAPLAKTLATVADALRTVGAAALRKPAEAGAALGRALAAQKVDATPAEVADALAKSLKGISGGWTRLGDIGKAIGGAVRSYGGKLLERAEDTGRVAGAGIRELGDRFVSKGKDAGKAVGTILKTSGGEWLGRAKETGVAVGSSLREMGASWLSDAKEVGAAVGVAVKGAGGRAASWWKKVEDRGQAVAAALKEGGAKVLGDAAQAGRAITSALQVVVGKAALKTEEGARALGAALAELSRDTGVIAKEAGRWWTRGKEVGKAMGTVIREAIRDAAGGAKTAEKLLVASLRSYLEKKVEAVEKKVEAKQNQAVLAMMIVGGIKEWRQKGLDAGITSFINTWNGIHLHDPERDGSTRLYRYEGPERRPVVRWDLSYGNGVLNPPGDRARNRAALLKLGRQPVTQVVNRTDGIRDLISCIREIGAGKRTPPSDAIADAIVEHVRQGRPMKHVAHSENTLQTAIALERAKKLLMEGGGAHPKMSASKAEKEIRGLVRVAGVGPAVGRTHTFVEGLLNVVFSKSDTALEKWAVKEGGLGEEGFLFRVEIPRWFSPANAAEGRDPHWTVIAHERDPISQSVGEGGLAKPDLTFGEHDFARYADPTTKTGRELQVWLYRDFWATPAPAPVGP